MDVLIREFGRNAFFANQIIVAINKEFGSNLPQVDVNSYVGNTITGK